MLSFLNNPRAFIGAATAGNKGRTEVNVKYAPDEERKGFDMAKHAECSQWLEHTVCQVSNRHEALEK